MTSESDSRIKIRAPDMDKDMDMDPWRWTWTIDPIRNHRNNCYLSFGDVDESISTFPTLPVP